MGEAEKISRDALVVVAGLIISVAWIMVGLVETPEAPGLSSVLDPAVLAYSLLVTFASLILIPICARENRWGFLSAMALGTITLLVEAANQMGYLLGTMPESSLFVLLVVGGVVWLIIQVPIILFSYRAYRRT